MAEELLAGLNRRVRETPPGPISGTTTHFSSIWYPTAPRVQREDLENVRRAVLAVARRSGFPTPLVARSPRARQFDQEVSTALYSSMGIEPVDAAQEGVWSFVSLVLLPDIALWRWPNTRGQEDYERLIGRPRNVFRRLWWRAHILGAELSESLLEDEAVAIMERPTLGSDPRLSRSIASNHLTACADNPGVSRSEVMRQTAKRLRRLSPIVAFNVLEDNQLHELVTEVVAASIAVLSRPSLGAMSGVVPTPGGIDPTDTSTEGNGSSRSGAHPVVESARSIES